MRCDLCERTLEPEERYSRPPVCRVCSLRMERRLEVLVRIAREQQRQALVTVPEIQA